MAEVTISQIGGGAIGAGSRSEGDRFELQQSNGQSKYMSRLNGFTVLESSLITLSSTNYLLNSTPLEVHAIPGNALQVLVPTHLIFYMDYNSVVFNFGAAGIDLIYSTATGTALINIPQAVINASSDQFKIFSLETPLNTSFVFNDSLELYAAADPSQGNSTVYIRVLYSLQDFNT